MSVSCLAIDLAKRGFKQQLENSEHDLPFSVDFVSVRQFRQAIDQKKLLLFCYLLMILILKWRLF